MIAILTKRFKLKRPSSVCIVIPTVPRHPRTLTHAVSTLVNGLRERDSVQIKLIQCAPEHSELHEVAIEFNLEVCDGTAEHPEFAETENAQSGKSLWHRKVVLDFARSLEFGVSSGADLVLSLEDDAECSSRIGEALYARTWLTSFFSNQRGINNYPFSYRFGLVGVLFQNDRYLKELISYLRQHEFTMPADHLLARFLSQRRLQASQRIPNPIQHRGAYSSREGFTNSFTSPTYNREGKALPPLQTYWAIRHAITALRVAWGA